MKYALIIGNDRYEDSKLARLKTPAADSQALATVLHDRAIGSFDEVTSLINQSESKVRRAVSAFLADKKPADLVLLYFSGHGVLDDRGRLYLALQDTQISLLKATSIPSSFIADEMDSCRSRRQILVLDCCHSGAFARGTKGEQKAITETTFEGSGFGRVVLTASDSTQYALEGDQVIKQTELSLFTHFLLEGLRSGEADMNNDGQVSLDEWYDYTYTRVIAETPRQVPHKWSYNQQGDLLIARNPFVRKRVVELPYELVQALESPFVGIRESAVTELGKFLRSHDPEMVRLAVASLERMKEDDSRRIASLAGSLLSEYQHERLPSREALTSEPRLEVKTEAASSPLGEAQTALPLETAGSIPHAPMVEASPAASTSSHDGGFALDSAFWLKWLGTVMLSAAGFYLLYYLSVTNDDPYYIVTLSGVVTGLTGLAQWYLFRNWLEPWWVPVQVSIGITLGYLIYYLVENVGIWQKEHAGVLFAAWAIGSLIVGILLMRNAQPVSQRFSALPATGTRRNIFFTLLSSALILGAISNVLALLGMWDIVRIFWILYGITAIPAGISFFVKKDLPRNFGMVSLAVFLILDGINVEGLVINEYYPLYLFTANAIPALASGIYFLARKETWRDFGFLMLSVYLVTNAGAGILVYDSGGDMNRAFALLASLFAVLAAGSFLIRGK
ncbi:MAG TPA: caspase family protein [Anaerolineales bacterium]|nr:caspase family protein [Anaerolineales bacterium]